MKTYIFSILIAFLLIPGCTQVPIADTLITSGVSTGTVIGLRQAIPDAAKRTIVANYIDRGAVALRAITGTPTPQELTALINQSIPAKVREDYPEAIAFMVPLVVSAYDAAYKKYGNGKDAQQIAKVLNDIALGLEAGAAPFISHP